MYTPVMFDDSVCSGCNVCVGTRAQRRQQHLDRGLPAQQPVLPEVHHPHPALSQLPDELIVTDDSVDHGSSWTR